MTKKLKCVHCRNPGVFRRRLCAKCFVVETIRDQYPPPPPPPEVLSKRAEIRAGQQAAAERRLVPPRPVPAEPTLFVPGSAEKVEVMRLRYAAGRHIHHPDDAIRDDVEPRFAALEERDDE